MIIRLLSADDPRIADFVGLTDVELRRAQEPERGMFLAEGALVIRRALEAGYGLRSLLMEPRWLESMADVVEGHPGAPAFVADEEVLRAITGYRVHRGALAAMQRRPLPETEELISRSGRLLVLEDIVDHTNVGAVFRSAAALGVDGVLVSPRCADPLYRRSVKVSMGAVLSVPWTRTTQWPAPLDDIRAAGITTLALTPSGDTSLAGMAAPERWALVLGTEGAGLSDAAMARCDLRVRIPMSGGVDSLNVAAAAAVACFALSRE